METNTIGKTESKSGSKYKWVVLVSNALLLVFLCMGLTTWSVAVGPLTESLGLTNFQIMLGASTFMLGFTVSSGIWGRAIEKIGFKKAGIIGIVVSVIAQFLIPGCTNVVLILILRFFMGFGLITVPLYYIVGMWFPGKLRGLAIGLLGAVFYGGFAVGGAMSGILVPLLGWQTTFYILASATLIGGIQWIIITRNPSANEVPEDVSEDDDAIKESNQKKESMFKSPALYWLASLYFVILFIDYALYNMSAVFLGAHNFNITQVGMLLFIVSMIGAVASPVGGIVSDAAARKSPLEPHSARIKTMIFGGVLITTVGCIFTPILGGMSFVLVAICLVFAGWGGPFMDAVTTVAAFDFFGMIRGDKALGYMVLLGGIGSVISPALTTWLGENVSWTVAWLLLGAVGLLGLVACIKVMKMKSETTDNQKAA